MKSFLSSIALMLLFANSVAAKDLSLRFTCDVSGFKAPLLFSFLGKGKGLFNNVEVSAFGSRSPLSERLYLINFLETTAVGNITLTTVYYDTTKSSHDVVHSRHIMLSGTELVPSQYRGTCRES